MWTPEEFVLHGTLCDDRSILDQLAEIRHQFHADAVVLLVLREGELFPAMLRVAGRPHIDPEKLQDRLVQACSKPSGPAPAVPDIPRNGHLDVVQEFLPPEIYSVLRTNFTGATQTSLIPSLVIGRSDIHPWDEPPPSFMLVVVGTSHHAGRGEQIKDSELLRCMLSASHAARASRWNHSMHEVDRRLDECERDWLQMLEGSDSATNDFERLIRHSARLLLKEAIGLTLSTSGQVFITRPGERKLEQYAWEKYECGPTLEIDQPRSEGLVSMSYDSVEAALINDIPMFERTHPPFKYKRPAGASADSRAELIIPITQNMAGDEHVVYGVLNLEKADTRYTTRDLDVCQQLARRFCRWWARIQHTIFARSLARLTQEVAVAPPRRRVPVWHWSEEHRGHLLRRGDEGDEWDDDRVPSEFWEARGRVEAALKLALELTRSHMVRVFLVTADGASLVPFCDQPYEEIHRREPVEPSRFEKRSRGGAAFHEPLDAGGRRVRLPVIRRELHNFSISAWVAEHGRACFIGNIDDPDAFDDYDGLESCVRTYDQTRSECCVPLFITGRLVGTLNFQSVYINVYRDQRHLIEAIAELIGLTFAHERRAVEQEILENHADLASKRHDLMHDMQMLITEAESIPDLPASFAPALASVKNQIEGINDPTRPPAVRPAQSVDEIVRGQLQRAKVQLIHGRTPESGAAETSSPFTRAVYADGSSCGGSIVPEESVVPFTQAVYESLENAKKHIDRSARKSVRRAGRPDDPIALGTIVLECCERTLGGCRYAIVRIRNRCRNPGPGRTTLVATRGIIRDGPLDRPHLGGLIVGSLLRSAGGEMSFAVDAATREPDTWHVATTQIEVKLEPRESHGALHRPGR